jgi:SAM-dependent methyltransferase
LPAETYFTDAAAYEQYIGRWTRAAGTMFLDWIAPPEGARWLDVGCGTGIFTELALEACAPASVVAVDPAAAQIEQARGKPVARRVDFRVADARELPFPDDVFDVVTSALVINFIPDRARALAEMRRVCRPGGVVAGYVWDLAAELGPTSLIRSALKRIGAPFPLAPGSEDTRLEALAVLFARAGLKDIATRTISVTTTFADFDEFWRTQTPGYSPIGKAVAALSESDRRKLIELLRASLAAGRDDSVAFSARANAIKAHVAG